MKTSLEFIVFFVVVCTAAAAQVVPAATGPINSLPNTGNLHYALRYSQAAQFNTAASTQQASTASGSAEYANRSERVPFSLDYAGGYTWTLAGPAYGTGFFQRLLLSQGINWHKWRAQASDEVSYLPQAPITGFSGIPGIGEPIGTPNPGPPSSQSILTLNTPTVENFVNGELEHSFDYATTASIGGSSELLRFPNGDGLDANSQSANGQINRRLNARNSLTGSYLFSRFSYPGLGFTFNTNTTLFGFKRQWSKAVSIEAAAGPQWIGSSNTAAVPPSTNISANAAINYQFRYTGAGVNFSHGANGGGGYLVGGEVTSALGYLARNFGRNLNVGLTGGFQRTGGLNNNGAIDASFGGAQATWQIRRDLIVFANYTGVVQTSTSSLPSNALNEIMQIVGFGVGYSPRQKRSRQ